MTTAFVLIMGLRDLDAGELDGITLASFTALALISDLLTSIAAVNIWAAL